jgi:hypothetical protein
LVQRVPLSGSVMLLHLRMSGLFCADRGCLPLAVRERSCCARKKPLSIPIGGFAGRELCLPR